MNIENKVMILVVDDNSIALNSVRLVLEGEGYDVTSCTNGEEAISKFLEGKFDAVLTDIKMPKITGIELLETIHGLNSDIPILLMTAYPQIGVVVDAVKKGAFDFILKPFEPQYIIHAVKIAVEHSRLIQMEKNYKRQLEEDVRKRTLELSRTLKIVKSMNEEIVYRLMVVAEFRDEDTGAHIKRIGVYSGMIAEKLGMSKSFVDMITLASTMHDIGKVGIPDNILRKPGPLTPEEWDIMKTHAALGGKMLAESSQSMLQMATAIALTHHERWDGSGYPIGLKGDEIPLEGRICMIADHYDALRSKRPYKPPFDHDKACKIIIEGDSEGGRAKPQHFEPRMLKAFLDVAPMMNKIYKENED